MGVFKKLKFTFILSCTVTLFTLIILYVTRMKLNNRNTQLDTLIPNIVHYVLFDKNTINFITYLSILSVIKVQKPTVIYIHANKHNFSGKYWNNLLNVSTKVKVNLRVSFFIEPTHVYGQRLSSIYHASDISRIFILRKYGGIYLDTDMIMINNINKLRKHDCVIGWPEKDYVGSQFIMAKNNSEFLKLWQEGYKKYKPRDWYYNAGRYPTELLEKNPKLAHVETEYFGVQNLLDKLTSSEKWIDWQNYYAIHILYRHNKVYHKLNETTINDVPINFSDIAKWVLHL